MTSEKSKAITHLKKAKNFIAKAIVMFEQGAPPVEVMQQITAAIRLLRSAQQLYVINYVEECLGRVANMKRPKKRAEIFQEILRVIKMYNK